MNKRSEATFMRSVPMVLIRIEFRYVLGKCASKVEVPNHAVNGARFVSAFFRSLVALRFVLWLRVFAWKVNEVVCASLCLMPW